MACIVAYREQPGDVALYHKTLSRNISTSIETCSYVCFLSQHECFQPPMTTKSWMMCYKGWIEYILLHLYISGTLLSCDIDVVLSVLIHIALEYLSLYIVIGTYYGLNLMKLKYALWRYRFHGNSNVAMKLYGKQKFITIPTLSL